jgi:hypothetical protein
MVLAVERWQTVVTLIDVTILTYGWLMGRSASIALVDETFVTFGSPSVSDTAYSARRLRCVRQLPTGTSQGQ